MIELLLRANPGDIARVLSIPALLLFAALCGWIGRRLSEPRPLPPHAIDSSNYKTPTHQVHVVDFDRSHVSFCQDGTVLARCCMQGCDVSVKIGRDIIGLIVGAELAGGTDA